ncbi:hypothetical protein BEWA_000010 [Theileria equi strain WA]|uniref:Uncharacterized protein n=1 Tax=Theileria equi strain WA TaxID=1537102 RepID=L1LBA9_THEEQ|nr:hypothetical protein BEWA_000010 [Theileria equi strain WA]EKX72616.1 hypothetical protein BEWA_000010 [Theileria equi strain WA]|eukprot:XP_004832068.1 hypothetical protein BEWA_000010 [Theileria equi strain WA]
MSGGIRLDLDPNNGTTKKDNVERTENSADHKVDGYTSYKYAKQDSKDPFVLSALLFGKSPLPGILSYPILVTYVTTYFNSVGTKLLLMHISVSDGNHKYYLNPDTSRKPENLAFTEFIPQNKQSLNSDELYDILQDITNNDGFGLAQFGSSKRNRANKLVGENYLIFNLERGPDNSYKSEITDLDIKTMPVDIVSVSGFSKVRHTPDYSQFRLLGIKLKNGQYMKVTDGFPNDPIEEFYVYYRDSDHNYNDPLLISLKIVQNGIYGINYLPSRYYITKNISNNSRKWDIRKIGSYIDERNGGLRQVLQSISANGKLAVDSIEDSELRDKLGDTSKGLTIDLTQTTAGGNGSTGAYTSDNISIPYKRESSTGSYIYHTITHAYNFPSFTIKTINTVSGEIGSDKLPPGTVFGRLRANYSGGDYNNLLFLELLCLYNSQDTKSPRYVYYYSKDGSGQWQGYILNTTVSARTTDMESVIKHLKSNGNKINIGSLVDQGLEGKIFKYSLESFITDDKNGILFDLTKKPKGSDSTSQTTYWFGNTKIGLIPGKSTSGHHKVKHDVGQSFTIKGVKLKDGSSMRVSGGFPSDLFTNFFVYYSKDNYEKYDDPLLITLSISTQGAGPESTPDIYLLVKSKDNKKWDIYRARNINEHEDENKDLTKILQNISGGGFDIKSLEQKVKNKLEKYQQGSGKTSSKETGAAKPLYKTVLEGFGGSGAGGFGAWEGYNLLLNPDRSLVMRLIRIFRLLL